MVPVVLTIGALDPLGADGVLADIRSFAALGVHGAASVTLVGAPARTFVHAPVARLDAPPPAAGLVDAGLVASQVAAVLAATTVAAVKLGALGSAATVRAVADALAACTAPVVADPSFAGRDGAAPDPALVAAWRDTLLPRAEVVTPNMAEAALLSGTARAATLGEMRRQGEALVALGCRHAVVSGGHGQGAHAVDILVSHDRPPLEMRGERLERGGMRGLSATLASAIAAHIAHGMPTAQAINHARLFVATALGAADSHGAGNGPLLAHQLYRMWRPRGGARDA